ncbi:MAG: TetR/AcrR family transcriptional regulator [Thiohalomonadaceae bacterium]
MQKTKTAESRSNQAHPDRRNDIRDEAARVFALKGFHGASVQEIADAIGFTKASIYYYYKSKEELLFDILTFADQQVSALLEHELFQKAEPLDQLERIVTAHVTWYLKHPNLAKVAFRDWGELSGDRLSQQIQRRRRYSHILRDLLAQCVCGSPNKSSHNITLAANFINGAVAAANIWFDPAGDHTPESVGKAFGKMAVAVIQGVEAP